MTVQVLQGDCRDGRFKRGERRSPATEFKPGEHWRPVQPFRDKAWLEAEYIAKERSAGDIGGQFGVTDAAILFWLRRHGIPRRSISETRQIKHWGLEGDKNPMFGKRGSEVPNWRGGISPERQAFYASLEWKRAAKLVRRRDKCCQKCGVIRSDWRSMHVHHIIPFAVKHLRCDGRNLVVLCNDCHHFVHSSRNVNGEFIGKEV